MEKRVAWGPLPSRRQERIELAQAELTASEHALAQQLERVAVLVAMEEEVMDVLEHVLSGDPIALTDVREQQYCLAQNRAALLDARATAAGLRTRMEARRQAVLAAQRDTTALPHLKERNAKIERHRRRG